MTKHKPEEFVELQKRIDSWVPDMKVISDRVEQLMDDLAVRQVILVDDTSALIADQFIDWRGRQPVIEIVLSKQDIKAIAEALLKD